MRSLYLARNEGVSLLFEEEIQESTDRSLTVAAHEMREFAGY
jgi:hypothetical protein